MKFLVVTVTAALLLGTLSLRAQQSSEAIATLLDSLPRLIETQYAFDSLKLDIWSDSLKSRFGIAHRMDSLDLVSKIDSLRNLDLPTLPYLQKFDIASWLKKMHSSMRWNPKSTRYSPKPEPNSKPGATRWPRNAQ